MRLGFCCLRSPRRSQPPSPCACSDVQKATGCSRATVAKIAKRVAAAQGPPFAFRSGRGAPYPRKRASGPLRPIAVAEGKGVADPRGCVQGPAKTTSLSTRPCQHGGCDAAPQRQAESFPQQFTRRAPLVCGPVGCR
jgi:hypothetical protein